MQQLEKNIITGVINNLTASMKKADDAGAYEDACDILIHSIESQIEILKQLTNIEEKV